MALTHTNDAMLAVLKAKYGGNFSINDYLTNNYTPAHSTHTRKAKEVEELDTELARIGSSEAKITRADKANKFWTTVVVGQL